METVLINELKPVYNIEKASYSEFIRESEDRLADVEFEIESLNRTLEELRDEINDVSGYFDSLGETLFLQREIKDTIKKINELKREAAILKQRGAKSLENKTVEEGLINDRKRKKIAYLFKLMPT